MLHTRKCQVVNGHASKARIHRLVVVPSLEWITDIFNVSCKVYPKLIAMGIFRLCKGWKLVENVCGFIILMSSDETCQTKRNTSIPQYLHQLDHPSPQQ